MTDGKPGEGCTVQISSANSATIVAGSVELTIQGIYFTPANAAGFTLTWDANALKLDVIRAASTTYRYRATSTS